MKKNEIYDLSQLQKLSQNNFVKFSIGKAFFFNSSNTGQNLIIFNINQRNRKFSNIDMLYSRNNFASTNKTCS